MYYITDECTRYYAGKFCSDNQTPVWKNHYTRARPFSDMKSAFDYAISEGLLFSTIEEVEE